MVKKFKMLRISGFLSLLLWGMALFAQMPQSAKSPHGKGLHIQCSECHDPNGWKLRTNSSFNHDKRTHFPLKGQHKMLDCRKCHPTLVFNEAKSDCNSCHTDVHQQTVGNDCQRCHNTSSWLVTNIKQIHQQKGFALVGAHAAADCSRCHKAASQLQFENMHTDCYACHYQVYESAKITEPNIVDPSSARTGTHREFGFNTDCYRCHNMVGRSWAYNGKGFEHGFFPLKGGHANLSCDQCHVFGFGPENKLDPDCKSCHEGKLYQAKQTYPAHNTAFASHQCSECHTYLGWNIVKFKNHKNWRDKSKHNGKGCLECHDNNDTWKPDCRKCHNFDY